RLLPVARGGRPSARGRRRLRLRRRRGQGQGRDPGRLPHGRTPAPRRRPPPAGQARPLPSFSAWGRRWLAELLMTTAIIAATGLFTPDQSISNAELVAAYNAFADRFNGDHADAIAAGEMEPLTPSSVEFIEKA